MVDNYIIFYDDDSPIKTDEKKILKKITEKVIFRRLDFEFSQSASLENFFRRYSRLCFAKFKILDLVNEYEKVLWLDADVLVLRDISSIFEYRGFAWRPTDKRLIESIDCSKIENIEISALDTRPNGGCILLARCSETGSVNSNEAIELFEMIKDIPDRTGGLDEIVLGLLAKKYNINVQILENKYNTVLQWVDVDNPVIIHCMGENKIWKNEILAILYPEFLENNKKWVELGGNDYTEYKSKAPATKNAIFKRIMWERYWLDKFMQGYINLLQDPRIELGEYGRYFVQIFIPFIDSRIHYELLQQDRQFIYEERKKEIVVVGLHIEKANLIDEEIKEFLCTKTAEGYYMQCDNKTLTLEKKVNANNVMKTLEALMSSTYDILINHYC